MSYDWLAGKALLRELQDPATTHAWRRRLLRWHQPLMIGLLTPFSAAHISAVGSRFGTASCSFSAHCRPSEALSRSLKVTPSAPLKIGMSPGRNRRSIRALGALRRASQSARRTSRRRVNACDKPRLGWVIGRRTNHNGSWPGFGAKQPLPAAGLDARTAFMSATPAAKRLAGEQWCPDCQRPCRRIRTGGPCPNYRGTITITITDLVEVPCPNLSTPDHVVTASHTTPDSAPSTPAGPLRGGTCVTYGSARSSY